MPILYSEQVKGYGPLRYVFEATDLEVRWLKAMGSVQVDEVVPGHEWDPDAYDGDLDHDRLHLTDETLTETTEPAGVNPFVNAFLADLGDEPGYVLDHEMVGGFTRDELEEMAARWEFPDWCCVWRVPGWEPSRWQDHCIHAGPCRWPIP